MNSEFAPIARQNDLVIQEMPDEMLVYDITANRAYCLNTTAASIWKLCSGERTLDDIQRQMTHGSGAAIDIDLIRLGIQELASYELLDEPPPRAFGTSRREVIRRIGMASVIALPVIASLTAPKSALAAVSCICNIQNGNLDCAALSTCPSTTNCNVNSICAP